MSFESRVEQIYANKVILTSRTGTNVDITCSTGDVLINGSNPSGGGASLPIIGTGNIEVQGNIKAEGNGSTTGLLEGQSIKSQGNLIVEGSLNLAGALSGMNIAGTGALTMNTGNISQSGGSFSQTGAGSITGGTGGIETGGDIEITSNGNLTLNGNGSILQLGSGSITSGAGGIDSYGHIKTIGAFDAEIGKDIYFDGQDIYHRTFNPSAQQNYKDYKQLAGLNDSNKFTGSNQFNSNTTEFAAKVSVGTRDPQSLLFTQNLALNTSGNIECKTINNATTINCGNIICDNGGVNSVAAKEYLLRTSGLAGWTISQEPPSVPAGPLDNYLIFQGGQTDSRITILDNAHTGSVANIELDPRTTINGGKITTTQYNVGEGTTGYLITQPKTGVNSENLLIMAGSGTNPKVIFDDYGSTTTLMTLEKEVGNNDGLLRVPHIEFGITGPRNRIYNEQSGATNLNLNIQHASASSEIVFQDNQGEEIMKVRNNEIVLGPTIPIDFGFYAFRPTQYYKDITGFSFNNSALGNTNRLFNTADTDWTNVNTGAANQNLNLAVVANRGGYKLSFRQTGAGTLGQINDFRFISDIVLCQVNDGAPQIILPSATAFAFEAYDGTSAPVITQTPGFLHYSVFAQFAGVSGNETSNIRITLTKMDWFA